MAGAGRSEPGDELIRAAQTLRAADVDRLCREAAIEVERTLVSGLSPAQALLARRVRDIEASATVRERLRRAEGAARAQASIARLNREPQLNVLRRAAADALDSSSRNGAFENQREVDEPVASSDDRLAAASDMLDLALLAVVAGTDVGRSFTESLAGPWWRAVTVRAKPAWGASWSRLSLLGFWLTAAASVFTIGVGMATGSQVTGTLANLELAAIGGGVALLVAGLLLSTSASRARLVPVARPPGGAVVLAQRLWRLPERAFEALVARR